VPEGIRGLEPFCALYTSACIPVIEASLDAGELRMSSLLQSFPTMTRVALSEVASIGDPARLFFNVNDAADLAIAEQLAAAAS
jgi:molybdopterin-guanine dinucleotide biosynthesis protein A